MKATPSVPYQGLPFAATENHSLPERIDVHLAVSRSRVALSRDLVKQLEESVTVSSNHSLAPMTWRQSYKSSADTIKGLAEDVESLRLIVLILQGQLQQMNPAKATSKPSPRPGATPPAATAVHAPSQSVKNLIEFVEKTFGIKRGSVLQQNRLRVCVEARTCVAYMLKQWYLLNCVEIGRTLHRDHTTVINLRKRFNDVVKFDARLMALYGRVEQYIQEQGLV